MNFDEYSAEIKAEYGKYVAKSEIFIGGVRAFNAGHPVPVSHVEAYPELLSEGLVAEVGAPETPAVPVVKPAPPQGAPIVVNP
jgi:hypothetical protein